MATNYPSGLDSLSNPAGSDALSTGHAAQHANANDAIEAIEGELGTDPAGASATVKARFDAIDTELGSDPSGASATVKARFEAIEANDWVTTARIANSQVTSAKIADATITGSDIATGTVTSTNIASDTIVNADINTAAAIDATKVAGTAVTQADTGTVTSAMIATGTIVNADINAAAAIDKTKISGTAVTTADSGSVTSGMILDGTIVNVDVSAAAAIAATKIAGTAVTHADSGTVTSTMIANGTIVDADINASAAIAGSKLADGAITPIKQSAGYTAKTALYTPTNDDRVIDCTSGTYTITLPTAVSQTGRTFIIRNSGTGTITIGRTGSETIAGAASQALAGLGFLEVVSNGTNWLVTRGQYADETVGRRLWTWNHAYSTGGGWQRTYGDTGWRNVTALATNFSGGNIYLRRVNDRVSIIANALASAAALDGTNLDSTVIVAHTTGFEPIIVGIESNAIVNQGGGYWQQMATYNGATDIKLRRMYRMGTDYPTTWASGAVVYFDKSFSTNVAWPTSLPGTAAGSIPT